MILRQAAVRRAARSDAAPFAASVMAACDRRIPVIGTKPGPMPEDYDEVVAKHRVYVADVDVRVVGVVPAATDEGLLLENIAVHPAFAGRGVVPTRPSAQHSG